MEPGASYPANRSGRILEKHLCDSFFSNILNAISSGEGYRGYGGISEISKGGVYSGRTMNPEILKDIFL
jgi:hypothetical protein